MCVHTILYHKVGHHSLNKKNGSPAALTWITHLKHAAPLWPILDNPRKQASCLSDTDPGSEIKADGQ